MTAQPIATHLIDGEKVRVTRFDFGPGDQTGWHEHGFDYVSTAVADCTMQLEEPDEVIRAITVKAGEAYRRPKGVRHNVINRGRVPMKFVEVALKL